MKKFFAVLMLAAALILPGLAQAKDAQTSMIDDVVKRGVLRVGFSSFVPWAMQDKNGEFVGFEIDVAKRLAKDSAWNSSLCPRSGPVSTPAPMAGKFDVIIGSMSVTPERNLKANFTVPYDYATIEVMANKEKTKGMKFPEDFNKPGSGRCPAHGAPRLFPLAKKVLPNATFRLFDDEAPAAAGRARAAPTRASSSAPLPGLRPRRSCNPDKLHQPSTGRLVPSACWAWAIRNGDPDHSLNVLDNWICTVDVQGVLPRAPSFLVQDDRLGSAASMSSGGSRKALLGANGSPDAEYGRQGRLFPTFGGGGRRSGRSWPLPGSLLFPAAFGNHSRLIAGAGRNWRISLSAARPAATSPASDIPGAHRHSPPRRLVDGAGSAHRRRSGRPFRRETRRRGVAHSAFRQFRP